MSIYSKADPARWPYKSGFNNSYEKDTDIEIGKLNIANAEFICPGDIVHLSENILLRFQAQFAPFFTPLTATVRAWFVPLRLVEDNTEWIITGSKNGKLMKNDDGSEVELPKFDKLFAYDSELVEGNHKVKIGGIAEQMFGMPTKTGDGVTDLDYTTIKNCKVIPALYWMKGYYRLWFDYYRDENLFDYEDFDDWWSAVLAEGKIGQQDLLPVNWKKDYLTSMLYAQQKGIAPVLNPFINNPQLSLPLTQIAAGWGDGVKKYEELFHNYALLIGQSGTFAVQEGQSAPPTDPYIMQVSRTKVAPSATIPDQLMGIDTRAIQNIQGGFNASELRLLFAQQKIFERLMRCGSRYVEYLMSNFGIAPADETLQRVQYLGGFKQSVVTSEVLQTGEGTDPVGTQRGHSISAGGNKIGSFTFKEFGLLYVTISVMPKAQYTQGINRKYGLVERFDFPNPSFQFLSEDEVVNGEVYVDTDTDESGGLMNDKTMGFQEMYAWLKSNRDMICGNLRGSEAYWTMPRLFTSRPNLNEQFLTSIADSSNFAIPFSVVDKPPIIMRAGNICHMWRNFAKYGTPGLLDHY